MPEWAMLPYTVMLPRLIAEQSARERMVLLSTNERRLDDEDAERFARDLQDEIERDGVSTRRRRRAPKVTLGFLQDAGISLKPPE